MGKLMRNKRTIQQRRYQRIHQPHEGQGVYLDSCGYYRFRANDYLVHRSVAYKIWKANRDQYPRHFSFYVVHHIDRCKTNNRINNLMLLSKWEHDQIHHREDD